MKWKLKFIYVLQTINLFETKIPELGAQINVKVFDCEDITPHSAVIADILSSHRSNYQ